ncbi:MAG: LamG domain-containing protein, partial [bacterium]|nr:LamG domain-containing protein [bacterium]
AHAGLILQHPNYTGLNQGLVGYWSFDGKDMSNLTAFDRSGNNNNGTLTNGPTRAIGKIGQALKFDGVNDYVNIGDKTTLELNFPLTISAWVKQSSIGVLDTETSIISKYLSAGNQREWHFSTISQGSQITFEFIKSRDGVGAGSLDPVSSATLVGANTWAHGAITIDSSGNYVFYLNGVPDGTGTIANTTIFHGTASATIGEWSNPAALFPGSIDDVRVYNRALTPAEILRLYNLGR